MGKNLKTMRKDLKIFEYLKKQPGESKLLSEVENDLGMNIDELNKILKNYDITICTGTHHSQKGGGLITDALLDRKRIKEEYEKLEDRIEKIEEKRNHWILSLILIIISCFLTAILTYIITIKTL